MNMNHGLNQQGGAEKVMSQSLWGIRPLREQELK